MIEEGGHRANSLLIKKNLHKTCQSLFFSATFPPDVVSFAGKMVENPDRILIEEGDEFLVSASMVQHTDWNRGSCIFFGFLRYSRSSM
jgi:superfamily II DNA/RNA helicase